MHPKTGGKMFVLHILFASLVVLQGMVQSSEVTEVSVLKGDTVSMKCPWDDDTSRLYQIKWYRNLIEFYRYVPSESPEVKTFSIPDNINLDENRSLKGRIVLTNVSFDDAGTYICEATSDAPVFQVTSHEFKLTVVDGVSAAVPAVVPNQVKETEQRGRKFSTTFPKALSSPDCPKMYTRVGSKCISFFYLIKIEWGEAKVFCDLIGGELISLSKGHEDFFSVTKYIRESGMTDDFWIGGRNANDRDEWTWLDGTSMELGPPYWAVRHERYCSTRRPNQDSPAQSYWYGQRSSCLNYAESPRPGFEYPCAAISFLYFYAMSDEVCSDKKSPLCELKTQ